MVFIQGAIHETFFKAIFGYDRTWAKVFMTWEEVGVVWQQGLPVGHDDNNDGGNGGGRVEWQ